MSKKLVQIGLLGLGGWGFSQGHESNHALLAHLLLVTQLFLVLLHYYIFTACIFDPRTSAVVKYLIIPPRRRGTAQYYEKLWKCWQLHQCQGYYNKSDWITGRFRGKISACLVARPCIPVATQNFLSEESRHSLPFRASPPDTPFYSLGIRL